MRIALAGVLLLLLSACAGLPSESNPPTLIQDARWEAGPHSATFDFAIEGPWTHVALEVSTPRGLSERLSLGPDVQNASRFWVGFLEPATEYAWRLNVTGPAGLVSAQGAFRTNASARLWAPEGPGTIQPGAQIDAGPCTLGFLLRDAENETLYATTAGHCVDAVGQRIALRTDAGIGAPFGTVLAFEARPDQSAIDWALIEIDTQARANASASIRHWTGPQGPQGASEPDRDATQGDTLCLYGWGAGLDRSRDTRHRCGLFSRWEERDHNGSAYRVLVYDASTYLGDSGAPVFLYENGEAVAIHTAQTVNGMLAFPLDEILDRALQGLRLDLRVARADYHPPMADPV